MLFRVYRNVSQILLENTDFHTAYTQLAATARLEPVWGILSRFN